MQKTRTVTAESALHDATPRPPPSRPGMKTRRRTYHDIDLRESVPRNFSLAMPKHIPRFVFCPPSPIPWQCTLRGSRDAFLDGGSVSRQRRLSKPNGDFLPPIARGGDSDGEATKLAATAAVRKRCLSVTAVPNHSKGHCPPMDSAQLGDGSDCGLSISQLGISSARGPRRSWSSHEPSRRRPSKVSMRDEEQQPLFTPFQLSGTAEIHAMQARLASFDTLRRLFIPLWRRYRFHLQMRRAVAIISKYLVPKVRQRRLRRVKYATDAIAHFLSNPHTRLRAAAHLLEARVVLIQHAYRRHRQQVQGAVELNYRKVRRDVEKAYWATVVEKREAEIAAQPPISSPVTRAVREILTAQGETRSRFSALYRDSRFPKPAATPTPTIASYELDVYTYAQVGRLPETLLRSELTSAIVAHVQRSAARAFLMDDFSTTRSWSSSAERSQGSRGQSAPTLPSVRRGMKSRAQVPRFLPDSTYGIVLDNTCYVTSLMRNNPMLRAHLRRRERPLESY